MKFESAAPPWPYISHEVFNSVAPYTIMFNREIVVMNVGNAINKLLPEIKVGSKFSNSFALAKPAIEFTFDNVILNHSICFTFHSKRELSRQRNVMLEGPIHMVQDDIAILNAETLNISSIQLVKFGNVDLHDSNHCVVFDHAKLKIPEPNSDSKELTDLVYDMGPSFMPKQSQQASQTSFQALGDKTVLVIDAKRLMQVCQNPSTDVAEAVGILQCLYAAYDRLIENYQLYKVIA